MSGPHIVMQSWSHIGRAVVLQLFQLCNMFWRMVWKMVIHITKNVCTPLQWKYHMMQGAMDLNHGLYPTVKNRFLICQKHIHPHFSWQILWKKYSYFIYCYINHLSTLKYNTCIIINFNYISLRAIYYMLYKFSDLTSHVYIL